MSDLVPPRPDLPAQDVSIPEMPAPERPLATWRWWEALLVYLLIMVVSAFAVLPIFQVIQPRGLANLTASAIIAIITVALLVLWLQRFHPGWTKVIGTTLVNEARLSYARGTNDGTQDPFGEDGNAQIGFKGVPNDPRVIGGIVDRRRRFE